MNAQQLVIANAMLKYFASRPSGNADMDTWPLSPELSIYPVNETLEVREVLHTRGYLQIDGSNNTRLTKQGWEAANTTIQQHEHEQEEKLNRKTVTISNSKNVNVGDNSENINYSSDDSFLRNNQNVKHPPSKATRIIRDILIGLFVTVIGGLILYWLTTKLI